MARRAPTPTNDRDDYVSNFTGGFMSVPQATVEGTEEGTITDESASYRGPAANAGAARSGFRAPPSYASNDRRVMGPRPIGDSKSRGLAPHSTLTPPPPAAYRSSPAPSHTSPFARPEPPPDAEFHWTDDASTIRPDDSVSQLDRNFTGKKRVMGPRPLVAAPPRTTISEEGSQESYPWIPPEMIPDGSVAMGGNTPPPLQPSYQLRSTAPYYPDEDDEQELVQPYQSSPNDLRNTRSSADLPLVANPSVIDGFAEQRQRDAVQPYQGYAAVGPSGDDEYDEYAPFSRKKAGDIETAGNAQVDTSGIRVNGGASGLLSYVKSFRPSKSATTDDGESKGDKYGMDVYPPSSQGFLGPMDREVQGSLPVNMNDKAALWQRWIYDSTSNEVRVEEHKRGVGMQKYPIACWALSLIMTIVLIVELVRMSKLTGSPIQTKPSFNVMIGPSGSVLINLGARFAGCMKEITGVSDISWICLANSNQASVTSVEASCTMSDICGFGGFPTDAPNQSFRFFVPIFLHAGVVHLVLNLLAQLVSSAQIERQMGTPKFILLYLASGMFGFVLGANFALVGQPSVGASGAIFGTHAAILVDLIAHWKIEYRPKRKLFYLILEIVVGLGLGLVPGVDNFAHIGGFLIGLLGSIVLFPIIHQSTRHRVIFIILRIVAGAAIVTLFVVLIRNFYVGDPSSACSWCRYLSCWPTASNNHCKGTGLSTISTSSFSVQSIVTVLLAVLLPLV